MSTNPKNTISQLKRLLGKKFSDPQVQQDLTYFPFKVVEGPNGECLYEVRGAVAATVAAVAACRLARLCGLPAGRQGCMHAKGEKRGIEGHQAGLWPAPAVGLVAAMRRPLLLHCPTLRLRGNRAAARPLHWQ